MDNPMFHLRDDPCQQPVHRVWRAEIEIRELTLEGIKIERGGDGALRYPLGSKRQLPSQDIIPVVAVSAPGKQGRDRLEWLGMMFHLSLK